MIISQGISSDPSSLPSAVAHMAKIWAYLFVNEPFQLGVCVVNNNTD